jgi:hypothetical protein
MPGTRRKPGRMGPHIDGLRNRLLELGYTLGSVRQILKLVAIWGDGWAMDGHADIDVSQLKRDRDRCIPRHDAGSRKVARSERTESATAAGLPGRLGGSGRGWASS